jgi:hypothetical protein
MNNNNNILTYRDMPKEKNKREVLVKTMSNDSSSQNTLNRMIDEAVYNVGEEKDANNDSPPEFIDPIIKDNGKTKRCPKNYHIDKKINKCRRKTLKVKNPPKKDEKKSKAVETKTQNDMRIPSIAPERQPERQPEPQPERQPEPQPAQPPTSIIGNIYDSISPLFASSPEKKSEDSETEKNQEIIERSDNVESPEKDNDESPEKDNVESPEKDNDEYIENIVDENIERNDEDIQKTPESFSENSLKEIEEPSQYDFIEKKTTTMSSNDKTNIVELEERRLLENEETSETDFLYPTLNDPRFLLKIAKRKEFFHNKYDGEIHPIEEQANILCNAKFELMPHQKFVKNFLSFNTPYNSLLLYHGLGSGKTCSAIGIAEEMRSYIKQVGIKHKIIVVASPNVQDNFRLQLFDDRKLKKISSTKQTSSEDDEADDGSNDTWNIDSCVGNSLINEINPTQLKGLTKEKVIALINGIIKTYYIFMGYGQLANYINEVTEVSKDVVLSEDEREIKEVKNIRKFFNNRLIIIDEVQNIRITDENNNKKTTVLLMKVAKYSQNMRLLLLSATPMYNSYKEIIWITNLMNINDKRSTIDVSQVFDTNGDFYVPPTQMTPNQNKKEGSLFIEKGRDLLIRKITGYISYVRGENPYTFPYRIYPKVFSQEHSFFPEETASETLFKIQYPTVQMNGKPIEEPLKYVDVYLNFMEDTVQNKAYSLIMQDMRTKSRNYFNVYGEERVMPTFENMDTFGYTQLLIPLEALNIIYPSEKLDQVLAEREHVQDSELDSSLEGSLNAQVIQNMVGKEGLKEVMNFTKGPIKRHFSYKKKILSKYGRIFHMDNLSNYSVKISNICKSIQNSRGVVIIYSQYIEGGIVPICLALEEMGFSRYCSNKEYNENFFKDAPCRPIDALTGKTREESGDSVFNPAKYVIITGDKTISPSNNADIKYATNSSNKYGEQVKVILISKAGSEGLDFNNIRQIHIMESWYNMNRIEQIIGRGVRNKSHCSLPFNERNVEIFMHSTILSNNQEEAADLYVYRLAERKAIQIGRVSRVLKENSVDCLLNIQQTNFTSDKLLELAENQNIQVLTSSGKYLNIRIGDQPFTNACDYMENCEYKCNTSSTLSDDSSNIQDTPDESEIDSTNYNVDFAKNNISRTMERIRHLFRENIFYNRDDLIREINVIRPIPIEEIYFALNMFLKNRNEYLYDKYGRTCVLVNRGNYYICMPLELIDEKSSVFETSVPIDYKRKSISLEIPKSIPNSTEIAKTREPVSETEVNHENKFNEILGEFANNFRTVFEDKNVNLSSKERNWYKHANKVIEHIRLIHEIPQDYLYKCVVFHMMDMLSLNDKLAIYEHYFLLDGGKGIESVLSTQERRTSFVGENNIIEHYVKLHLKHRILQNEKNEKAVVINVQNNWKIYVFRKNSADSSVGDEKKFVLGEPEDYKDFARQLDVYDIEDDRLHDLVGFINMFKNGEMVFKTKYVNSERNNIGVRCGESSTKGDVVKTLNFLLKNNTYDNTTPILHSGLCVVLEILLRYKTYIEPSNGIVYFLSPEETAINDIVKYQR